MLSPPHEQNPAEYKKGGFDEVDVDLTDKTNKLYPSDYYGEF